MKLKKILAGAVAAAMALTTMAVTSFAADDITLSTGSLGEATLVEDQWNPGSISNPSLTLDNKWGNAFAVNGYSSVEITYTCTNPSDIANVYLVAQNGTMPNNWYQQVAAASESGTITLDLSDVQDKTYECLLVQVQPTATYAIGDTYNPGFAVTSAKLIAAAAEETPDETPTETVAVDATVKAYIKGNEAGGWGWADCGDNTATIKADSEAITLTWASVTAPDAVDSAEKFDSAGIQVAVPSDYIGQKFNVDITNITLGDGTLSDTTGTYTFVANWNNTGAEVMIPLGLTYADVGKAFSCSVKLTGELTKASAGGSNNDNDNNNNNDNNDNNSTATPATPASTASEYAGPSIVPANSATTFEITDPVTGEAISASVNRLAKALSKITEGSELTFDTGDFGIVLRKNVIQEIVDNGLTLTIKTSKATFIIDAENLAKVKTINIPAIMKTTTFKELIKEGNTFNVIVTEKNRVEIELA